MNGERIRFQDRHDAGQRLGALLARLHLNERGDALVLALPRGGVVVGAEVARALGAPLDILVARKLGAPFQPELAIGAIAPGGVRVLEPRALQYLRIPDSYVDEVTENEQVELERRQRAYRGDRPPPEIRGRTVILVDDGLATGMTARAAVHSLRLQEPRRLLLAVPVAAADTAHDLRRQVDDLITLAAPEDFQAVGLYYADFSQTTDAEVLALLAEGSPNPVVRPPGRLAA